MAWTSPRTWVSSELVTAAIGNTHWRDNLLALFAGAMSIASQTSGDFIYAASSTQLARLARGSALQSLRVNAAGNGYEFADPADATARAGGIAIASQAANDVIYAASSSQLARLAANATATNKFLRQVSSGAPSWQVVTTSDVGAQPASARLDDLAAGVLWRQKNRIDANLTIPDGENAVMVGPFEVGPDVVVTGLGNSCFRGL